MILIRKITSKQNSKRRKKEKMQQKLFIEGLEVPLDMRKEVVILYELGLEDYEISYLINLRRKQKASRKWI